MASWYRNRVRAGIRCAIGQPIHVSNPIHVAIIGAGGMGTTHARSFARLSGVVVSAVADTDPQKAATLAEKYDSTAYSDLESLLGAHRPDIAVVAVPTDTHTALACAALEAGVHVLIEKPLALRVSDAKLIEECASRHDRFAGVGQCVRFFPEYSKAKALVDSGAVGRVAAVRCRRGGGFPTWSPWFGQPERSGGVLFDLGVHEFDWLLWCFGPVERVYARALTEKLDSDDPRDYSLATLRHSSGAISHVECCWADPATGYTAYEIAGDQGLLSHDSRKAVTLTKSTRDGRSASGALSPDDDPYHRQAAAVLDRIAGRPSEIATVSEGRAAVAVAEAALRSAQTGKVVTL